MYAELKKQLVYYSHKCYSRGYVSGTSGNISVRTPDNKGILIKTSGTCFGDVDEGDFVFMDWDGNYTGEKKPSKEAKFHMGILKQHAEFNSVVHLHSPHSIALSISSEGEFPLKTISAKKIIRKVPFVAPYGPGSEELAESVLESFEEDGIVAVCLKEHGIVTAGKSLQEAFYIADLLEHNSRVVCHIR